MSYIQIQTQIDGKKLSFEIESNDLHQLNCLSHMHTINKPDKILSLLIIKDMIILLTEDRDFRNGELHASIYKDNRQINNIDAYDWNGKHLWNIGNIVGDIKTPFTGATLTVNGGSDDMQKDLLICFTFDHRFVIDPINSTVISKTCGKWRAFSDAAELIGRDATLSSYPELREAVDEMFMLDASVIN